MARTHEDLERYIMNGLIPFEQIGETTWLLNDPSWEGAQIVVQHTDPLVVFRCKLFDVPKMGAEAELSLYKTLLRLNATEMLQVPMRSKTARSSLWKSCSSRTWTRTNSSPRSIR